MAKNKNVLNTYRDRALGRISRDEKEYHRFLEYCGRGNIHKLSFHSQLVLFEQKPFAQVVAGYDAWNGGVGNRILSGSHGAGIYEEPGMSYRGYLERNVFDISETDKKYPVLIWQLEKDKRKGLAYYLIGRDDLVGAVKEAAEQYLRGMLVLDDKTGRTGEIKGQMEHYTLPEGILKEDAVNFIRDSILEIVLKRLGYEGENVYLGDFSKVYQALGSFEEEEKKRFLSAAGTYASHAGREITLYLRDVIQKLNQEKERERKGNHESRGDYGGGSIPDEPKEGVFGGGNPAETNAGEEKLRPDAVHLPFGEAGPSMPVHDTDGGDAASLRRDGKESQGDAAPEGDGVPDKPQKPHGESLGRSADYGEGQGNLSGGNHQRDGGSAFVGDKEKEPLLSGKDTGKEEIPPRDFYSSLTGEREKAKGYGSKTGFNQNIEAIRLLKKLKEENRNASLEEQRILSRYMGWGGLPQAFDEKNAAWEKEYKELKSLLGEEEYEKARASTLTAFYTDEAVIKAMWEKVMEMGFAGGNVLEPAMGTGKFYSAMPEALRDSVVKYGVELDPVSAGIARKLHPNAHIETGGFETNGFGENQFDLVIGNVPFGDFKVYDPKHKKEDFTIHNYFFIKALDAVREGGIVAFLTSTGTMDALDGRAREYIAARADLLGAVRLPQNAFAATDTASDIIFLKKRGDIRFELPEWTVSKTELLDSQTGKAVSHLEGYRKLTDVFTEEMYEHVIAQAVKASPVDFYRFAVEEYLKHTPKEDVIDVLSRHFKEKNQWVFSRLTDFLAYDKKTALGHLHDLCQKEGGWMEIYDFAETYGVEERGAGLPDSARHILYSMGYKKPSFEIFFRALSESPYEGLKRAAHNEILAMVRKPWWFSKKEQKEALLGLDEMVFNQYFAAHPEMILGKMRYETGRFGEDSRYTACVNDEEGFDLGDALKKALGNVTGDYRPASGGVFLEGGEMGNVLPAPAEQKNFTYTVMEGGLYYKNNSVLIPYQKDKPKNISRIKKLLQIKEAEKEILAVQLMGCSDKEFLEKRQKLNRVYDDFVKTEKYHVSDAFIGQIMSDDVEYPLLCALENRDAEGEVKKADIFFKRTVHPKESYDRVETPMDALNVSLNKLNRVDLSFMGELLGEGDYKKITDALKGVIYLNPAKYLKDDYTAGWETAEEYLSGKVRDKLKIAQLYLEKSPELFAGNVEALEKSLPEWLDASKIEVHLGTPWIPEDVYQQFILELLKPHPYLEAVTKVERHAGNHSYRVSPASSYDSLSSATDVYGTKRMNAAEIIESLLNLKTIEIKDKIYDADKEKDVYVMNARETAAAQAKADVIKDAFKEWFWKDMGRRQEYEEYYNNTFNNIKLREYDGSMLNFEGISSQINLRPHQKNAVARVLRGRNTLLAHCVGAGKTFEMECACMELKRLGLAHKPLLVVPNHLTTQTAGEFLRLYPSANLLLAHKKDFEKKNRRVFISKIATGEYDCIIMGFSQFEKISMSPEYEKHMLKKQKEEMLEAIRTMERERDKEYSVKQIEKSVKAVEERIKKLMDAPVRDDMIYFENLGIDCLIVDEAHEYKNLGITTKMSRVSGIPTQSAQKAFDLYMKKCCVEGMGGKIVFATGTPVSNTMGEMYVMMKYLYEKEMEEMGITCFDAWASLFGEVVPMMELKVTGDGYRTTNRFAKFVNVPELMTMYKMFADIVLSDAVELNVPKLKNGKYTIVEALPDENVKRKMEEFAERADLIQAGRVSPKDDNMLNITNEARLLGTDIRLLDETEESYEGSKLNLAVDNIVRIYKEFDREKGTQIVFSDIGTPTGKHPFNVYDCIREGCVKKGIPEKEIAYIHDADTEKKKDELFAAVNNGTVRVLIGSTAKMGTGMNVQKRVCALHEIDVPWRPADVEQREGRAIRQGNIFKEVEIFRYVTKQTFDAYSYQMLERKQGFISQVMGGEAESRTCEDIDDKAVSYAEIKSLASGNPLIEEKFKVDAEVMKLKLLKQQHVSNKYRMEREAQELPEKIRKRKELVRAVTKDLERKDAMLKKGGIKLSIGKKECILPDFGKADEIEKSIRKAMGEAILAFAALTDGRERKGMEIGAIGGFHLSVVSDIYGNEKYMVIEGDSMYSSEIGKDAYGNFARLARRFYSIGEELFDLKEKLKREEANLETIKGEIEKPFAKEEELALLLKKQEELNARLTEGKETEQEGREGEENTSKRHR